MFINEIASESVVELQVRNKEGKEIVLHSTVVMPIEGIDNRMVLVEPFRHNDQILTFSSVLCIATITNSEDNKIYRFKLRGVLKTERENEVYHCLVCNEEVSEENRRNAKRFGVSARGDIQLLGTNTTIKGYVRDVSATGIAFFVNACNLCVGDKVSVAFSHDMTGARVKVIAQIVRIVEEEKGVLFGCVVHKHDAKFTQVVSYLMRQECKIRG